MRLKTGTVSPRVSLIPLWILCVASLSQFVGCSTTPDTADNDTTNTIVNIVSVESVAGDFTPGEEESQGLLSDVCAANEDNPPCTVFNDNIIVTFSAFPKDLAVFSSNFNDVIFERYRVTYTRADGRNVPGVDVPYPFDAVQSFSVPIDGTEISRAFIVVRHQAKRESPLREISFGAGNILSVLARVDFYGRDLAGRNITVSAHLSITFADFAND